MHSTQAALGAAPLMCNFAYRLRRLLARTLLRRCLQYLQQLVMDIFVAADDVSGGERIVTALDARYRTAGLAHQDLSGGDVPGRQVTLPGAVQAACGHEGEIERGGAEAAQARHLVLDRRHLGAEHRVVSAPDMRQPAADRALAELAASGDAQPLVVEESTLAALGDIELVIGGVVDHARNDRVVALQSDRDRELRNSVQEIGGA